MQHHIRLIQPFELDALVRIYNQAVEAGLTADTTPVDIAAKRDWFQEHSARQYPIYVAESVGQVIGWSSLSLYRGGRSGVKKRQKSAITLILLTIGKEWAGLWSGIPSLRPASGASLISSQSYSKVTDPASTCSSPKDLHVGEPCPPL